MSMLDPKVHLDEHGRMSVYRNEQGDGNEVSLDIKVIGPLGEAYKKHLLAHWTKRINDPYVRRREREPLLFTSWFEALDSKQHLDWYCVDEETVFEPSWDGNPESEFEVKLTMVAKTDLAAQMFAFVLANSTSGLKDLKSFLVSEKKKFRNEASKEETSKN